MLASQKDISEVSKKILTFAAVTKKIYNKMYSNNELASKNDMSESSK